MIRRQESEGARVSGLGNLAIRATGAVVGSGSDGVNLNRSPPHALAEPARFWLLGTFCGGPKSPWCEANDPFEVKTELALV
jgi:hypothetical protein